MRTDVFIGLLAGVLDCGSTLLAQEPNPVKTELGLEEAWTGQAVPLMVTLVSPGPFSGTPVFQLPEIPGILIVKQGSPLIGSETVNGESMITQRHEFSIYTQKTGTLEIPAFTVDYESKETFVGDPVPRTGKTSAVAFASKRPPGTDDLPFVVSSATLTGKESWSPSDQAEFAAGDILSRTITREASDVSAMFLQPFQPGPIDGVRIYAGEPEVADKRERGVLSAKRVDTIKYQFERGGTFTIPDISYAWWNPKTEKVEQANLEGRTVSATAPPEPPKPTDWGLVARNVLFVFLGLVVANWLVVSPLERRYRAWQKRRNAPDAVAARALDRACRENDPERAYREWMNWQRSTGFESPRSDRLQEPVEELSRHLFSGTDSGHRWDGSRLQVAFREHTARRKKAAREKADNDSLPPLNPRPVA